MKLQMQVTARSGLNIRKGPGMNYSIITAMTMTTIVIATKCENGWYYHDHGGWSCGDYLMTLKDLEPVSNPGATSPQPSTPVAATPAITEEPMTADEEKILNSMFLEMNYNSGNVDDMSFIFSLPHQFTGVTDPRPDGSDYGRMFMSTMLSDIPLMVITPGKASFLKGVHFGAKARNSVKNKLAGAIRGEELEAIDTLLNGKNYGRYYTFETDYTEYMQYVNNMCRISAMYLGIADKVPEDSNTKYKNFDWDAFSGNHSYKKGGIFNFLSEEPSIAFFVDGKQTSYNEGMSNSTEQSMIASAVNKGGDTMREFRFLFNSTMDDSSVIEASKTNYESAVNKILNKVNLNKNGFANQLTDYGTTIISGANIAFPEIYKDSNYGRNYGIEIKLISPYGDKESIYWNVLVPLWHLVALAFPRQLGRAGYMHPFIVRAFCKGWFNCNLGIVDNISIRKAPQGGWSKDGLPTEIEVTLSLKDLYENVALSRSTDLSTFSNTEYLDFLGTMCGININKPDLERKAMLYTMWLRNKITDIPGNVISSLQETIGGKLRNFMK